MQSLAAGALRLPATADQLLDQAIAVIALDLDAAVAARAARAAAFLEFRRERVQFIRRQAEPRDDGNALALATLRLTADPDRAAARDLAGRALLANALADRAQTIRTPLADASGVDDSLF